MTIRLHQGDCLPAMKQMKDNEYDLAIVDPPYGIGLDKEMEISMIASHDCPHPKKKEYKQKNWDNETPTQQYFDELFRISRNQIIWGCNYFTDKIPVCGGRIYWSKGVTMPTLGKGELAFCSLRNSIDQIDLLWAGYRKCELVDRIHPTQKPVALYQWILSNYAKPGDRIIDTHLGSGSIAIACHDNKFDLDAWELDEEYYMKAKSRLEAHQQQLQLF